MIFPLQIFSILTLLLNGWLSPISKSIRQHEKSGIVSLFKQLPTTPISVPLQSHISFDEKGGHIQGIQLTFADGEYQAYLAGSSKDAAYIALVNFENGAQVSSIDTLMESPYRHAGGFQIHDGYLAVGIEDNQVRTSSKVLIYDTRIKNGWKNPIYTLARNGPFERSTAGAVGITKYKEEILLVVADWNSRNLDFFSCPVSLFEKREGAFSQIGSLEINSLAKQSWSDSIWHSYQNISLLADKSGLYAMTFGRDVNDKHVADLFSINIKPFNRKKLLSPVRTTSMSGTTILASTNDFFSRDISVEKISTKYFQCADGGDFRAGAGIHYTKEGLILSAAPNYVGVNGSLNFFAYPPEMVETISGESHSLKE